MRSLSPKTILRASSDCVVRDVSGEIVLLNLRNGTYYGLEPTGAFIWSMLAKGADLDHVVTTLHDRSGEDADRIEADVRLFLDDLLDHALVDIDDLGEG